MIKVERLSKSFGNQLVLDDVNLQVRKGEILVVMGESGSGKTVFLQHLIGLLTPDAGRIEISGRNIVGLPERELLQIRRNIGYLFQEGALYDFMNVFENVAFPLQEHTNLNKEEIAKKVRDTLHEVGLSEAEEKFPNQLSGGMKKRAALARSIILGSEMLFCDEPTSGLDPTRSRDISDLIHSISRKYKSTTVITSHDIENSF
ncbi:MAG: ATP-binding cassette domain-containing protein, partial [Candidatus Omnitrophota bacterium]|nr:ATP-binding cassette domain-containing protein [Candidatus Omnitrophota bacterium]